MRIRVSHLKDRKQRREKFAVLTAYDATMARLLERAGVDVLLVGDSVATAVLGYDTTLPVTLDVMIHHTAAVVRGTERALVIADMPFLTYQITPSEAVRNAGRLLKDAGAAAVKVEGGGRSSTSCAGSSTSAFRSWGISACLPQSVNQQSGYRQRGRDPHEAELIFNDALALQDAGAFAVVLEAIPPELAARITAALDVPTIGIGAGPDCDGQVLVSSDLLGLHDRVPPFAKKYADLAEIIVNAARAFVEDVQATAPASPLARLRRTRARPSRSAGGGRVLEPIETIARARERLARSTLAAPSASARSALVPDHGRAARRACGADRRRAPRVRRRRRHDLRQSAAVQQPGRPGALSAHARSRRGALSRARRRHRVCAVGGRDVPASRPSAPSTSAGSPIICAANSVPDTSAASRRSC